MEDGEKGELGQKRKGEKNQVDEERYQRQRQQPAEEQGVVSRVTQEVVDAQDWVPRREGSACEVVERSPQRPSCLLPAIWRTAVLRRFVGHGEVVSVLWGAVWWCETRMKINGKKNGLPHSACERGTYDASTVHERAMSSLTLTHTVTAHCNPPSGDLRLGPCVWHQLLTWSAGPMQLEQAQPV